MFLRLFKSKNPQLVKKYVYDVEKREMERVSIKKHSSLAHKYQFLGDFYWSKNSIVSGTIAGWYYVLSAECFENIEQLENAGYLYHYAGNQFRRIGTLEKAMKFYYRSANIHFEVSNPKEKVIAMAHRSTRRAIGLSKSSGDEEILKDWMSKKPYFAEYVAQYKDQNIWD